MQTNNNNKIERTQFILTWFYKKRRCDFSSSVSVFLLLFCFGFVVCRCAFSLLSQFIEWKRRMLSQWKCGHDDIILTYAFEWLAVCFSLGYDNVLCCTFASVVVQRATRPDWQLEFKNHFVSLCVCVCGDTPAFALYPSVYEMSVIIALWSESKLVSEKAHATRHQVHTHAHTDTLTNTPACN